MIAEPAATPLFTAPLIPDVVPTQPPPQPDALPPTSVPEPASLLTFALGAGVTLLASRRRQQR